MLADFQGHIKRMSQPSTSADFFVPWRLLVLILVAAERVKSSIRVQAWNSSSLHWD